MLGNNADSMEQILQQLMGQMTQMEEDIPVRDMELPMDEGLEVTLKSVPADAFDESHTHVLPGMDAILLHLVPPEAQRFDEQVTAFCETTLGETAGGSVDAPEESVCPCCDEVFDAKREEHEFTDVSIDADNLDNVCISPVGEEIWYYYHGDAEVTQ